MQSKTIALIKRNRDYIKTLPIYEQSVFEKIIACKTEVVPSLYTRCDSCDTVHPVYKSCKDRMCPICNKSASIKWTAHRESELLSTPYFMLTYTVPSSLREIFLLNKELCYSLFFKAVSRSLLEGIQKNEREFHGKAGFFAVLHTWEQRLLYHPHIHVVIPGGCISDDSTRWVRSRSEFLLPVKKQSSDFRKKLIQYLRAAYKGGQLIFPEDIQMKTLFEKLEETKWVVHSQPPGQIRNNPAHVVRYLSRYVAKSPVNDRRISRLENGNVHLRYYDRKQKKQKNDIITEVQFLKRMVLHILPKGFKKIRFYGFMSNRFRKSKLALCRVLLGEPISGQIEIEKKLLDDIVFLYWKYFEIDISRCPDCAAGHIHIVSGYTGSG
jgi:hypothetical protein